MSTYRISTIPHSGVCTDGVTVCENALLPSSVGAALGSHLVSLAPFPRLLCLYAAVSLPVSVAAGNGAPLHLSSTALCWCREKHACCFSACLHADL